jgi:hypothetical protein
VFPSRNEFLIKLNLCNAGASRREASGMLSC